MKFAVVVFPGSNCDRDYLHVLGNVLRQEVTAVWHQDTSLGDAQCVILPGGFSYGDYLRTGALACFSPIMEAVRDFTGGGPAAGRDAAQPQFALRLQAAAAAGGEHEYPVHQSL